MNSIEIEDEIEEQLGGGDTNRIFVFDEFQYAATIYADGMEKDNKNGLKPFWELLDTGVLHKRAAYGQIRTLVKLINYMDRINAVCPMKITDGEWVNADDCIITFNAYDRREINDLFKFRTVDDTMGRLDKVKISTKNMPNVVKEFFLDYYTLR